MLTRMMNYVRTGKHQKSISAAKKKAEYKALLFRAWELEFLAKAARSQYGYECPEYSPEQEKAVVRLIKKLENNFASQARKEGYDSPEQEVTT